MRLSSRIIMGFACVVMVGCNESLKEGQDRQLINTELVNSLNDIAIENAIISQHTLFPYHFIQNGSALSELGNRDFAVLAKHFAQQPGVLNIRRNGIPSQLYEARVALIVSKLKEAGVDATRVSISDGMPGGPGMPSERIVTILGKSTPASLTETTTSDGLGIR